MPLQRIRGSERTREGGEHGQAEYDASRVHEAGRRHRGRRCRGCAYGRRAGRVEQRHPKQGGRDQARAFLLPRLRQDGMRRVGHRRERPRHPHGRRRERVPFHGQPLRQGPGVAAGGVPPRPLVPSHEAHERPRRGRSRLGAHQLGRGDEHHRREAAGDDGPLRRRVHFRHVGHQPHLGHVRIWRARPAGRQPEHVHPVAGVQGPALLRHRAELHDAGIMDGDGRPPEGVHVLGHRPGAFELRRCLPYRGRRRRESRHAHRGRSAHDQLGQGGRHLAEPAPRHRWRHGHGLVERADQQRPVRRPVRQEVDRRAVPGLQRRGALRLRGLPLHQRQVPDQDAPAQGKRPEGRRRSAQVHGVGQPEQPHDLLRRRQRFVGRRDVEQAHGRPRRHAGASGARRKPGLGSRSDPVRPGHRPGVVR